MLINEKVESYLLFPHIFIKSFSETLKKNGSKKVTVPSLLRKKLLKYIIHNIKREKLKT